MVNFFNTNTQMFGLYTVKLIKVSIWAIYHGVLLLSFFHDLSDVCMKSITASYTRGLSY